MVIFSQKRQRKHYVIQMYSDIYYGLTAGSLKGNIDVILACLRLSKM